MRKRLGLVASFLVVMVLLVSGCLGQPDEPPSGPSPTPPEDAEHPKGMESPRELTDAEKAKVVEIALNTREALEWLEKESKYDTRLAWAAIVWKNSKCAEWRLIDYDWEADENLEYVPESAVFYVDVFINFGDPVERKLNVDINPDTGEVVYFQGYPPRGIEPNPPKDTN